MRNESFKFKNVVKFRKFKAKILSNEKEDYLLIQYRKAIN